MNKTLLSLMAAAMLTPAALAETVTVTWPLGVAWDSATYTCSSEGALTAATGLGSKTTASGTRKTYDVANSAQKLTTFKSTEASDPGTIDDAYAITFTVTPADNFRPTHFYFRGAGLKTGENIETICLNVAAKQGDADEVMLAENQGVAQCYDSNDPTADKNDAPTKFDLTLEGFEFSTDPVTFKIYLNVDKNSRELGLADVIITGTYASEDEDEPSDEPGGEEPSEETPWFVIPGTLSLADATCLSSSGLKFETDKISEGETSVGSVKDSYWLQFNNVVVEEQGIYDMSMQIRNYSGGHITVTLYNPEDYSVIATADWAIPEVEKQYYVGTNNLNMTMPVGTWHMRFTYYRDYEIVEGNSYILNHGAPTFTWVSAGELSGIATLSAADDAAPVYYTLQGRRIMTPQPGQVVIRLTGITAQKVVL